MTFTFRYVLNKLVGFHYNNHVVSKEYLYQRNIQGDILGIYDDEGNQVGEYAYDGYGNQVIVKDEGGIANLNPFRYRGYFYDEETGFYDLNARYYDPETGRFISPDTLSILDETKGQMNGLNLYMYCADNPIMNVDLDGHFPFLAMLLTGLIMGTAMIAFQGISDLAIYARTGNWAHVVWQDYVGNFIGGFIGGVLSVVMASGLAVSLVTTGASWLVSMELQNATGDANYSTLDIVKDVGLSMFVTAITYGLTYGIGNRVSGNNYFKTYSDLPYLLGHGLTEGVERRIVNQFFYQYIVMTMNMGLIASLGDYNCWI